MCVPWKASTGTFKGTVSICFLDGNTEFSVLSQGPFALHLWRRVTTCLVLFLFSGHMYPAPWPHPSLCLPDFTPLCASLNSLGKCITASFFIRVHWIAEVKLEVRWELRQRWQSRFSFSDCFKMFYSCWGIWLACAKFWVQLSMPPQKTHPFSKYGSCSLIIQSLRLGRKVTTSRAWLGS